MLHERAGKKPWAKSTRSPRVARDYEIGPGVLSFLRVPLCAFVVHSVCILSSHNPHQYGRCPQRLKRFLQYASSAG
jgi:hypothetical protein